MNDVPAEPFPERLARLSRSYGRFCWVGGVALFLGIVWYIGWREICEAVSSVNLKMLGGLMLAEGGTEWIRALKWRYALGKGNNGIGLFFLSKAAGNWTPGRLGELSPLALRRHRTPKVGAWIVADRLFESSLTIALGLLGLVALGLAGAGAFLGLALAACVALFGVVYVVTRHGGVEWTAGRTREGSVAHRLAQFLAAAADEVRGLRKKLPLISLMTIAAAGLDLVVLVAAYQSFGYRIPFPLAAAAKCAHGVVSGIPVTPNATGAPHVASAALLNKVAGIPSEVLAVAAVVREVAVNLVFWTSFAFGVADLRRRKP